MADTRTIWFAGVVQERIESQMRVLDWLRNDSANFKMIYIRHDKDKKPKIRDGETIVLPDAETDDGCEVSESGLVFPHFHLLVKTAEKISPKGLSKSFANYVHFQRCTNQYSYFQYLLHRSFSASLDENKYKYDVCDLQTNDDVFLKTFLTGSAQSLDVERRVIELLTIAGSIPAALQMAIDEGEWDVFKEIKSHAYFYAHFFK